MQPDPLSRHVSDELAPGEQLLWSGRPDPIGCLIGGLPVALIGMPWTLLAASILAQATNWIDRCGSLFFVAIGIGMLVYPVFAMLRAQWSEAAITDRRIIVSKWTGSSVTSIQRRRLLEVKRKRRFGRTVLLVPRGLIQTEDGKALAYLELVGFRDAETAYRLLIQPV